MAYSLATSYAGDALINGFNWFDTPDPSHGYVRYQSQSNAASQGLVAVDELTGVVRLGVDSNNTYPESSGRPSIRIESKLAYNQGLFIGDFLHMPPSQCGVWPAFWAYGPLWPAGGEIDIIEGANNAHRNIMSAHTKGECELGPDVLAMAAGTARTTNCTSSSAENVGCGYVAEAEDTSSYGDTFNAIGGGIYAMLWDDDYIKIWHFDRASAPADIAAKRPDPAGWPRPQAVYGGDSCDVGANFHDMRIVLNINFCGDYGDAEWASDGCTALAPTCAEWVGQNPAAFANAYWDVNYIDAYVVGPAGDETPSISGKATSANVNRATSSPDSLYITAGNTQTATAVAAGRVPTQALVPRSAPSDKAHANPANIDDFSYLGCFGSSSGFSSFTKVDDSADMDLAKCTSRCRGKKYAGLFDTGCYCATELDPDTRVSADVCDAPCPGDPSQFCGGRIGRLDSDASGLTADGPNGASPIAAGPVIAGPIAATANITKPQSTSSVVSGGAVPVRPSGGGAGSPVDTNKFKPSGSGKATPTGTRSPAAPPFANSTAPEILADSPDSPDSLASGSSVAAGTGASGTASPMISSAAKFNDTGFAKPSGGFQRAAQGKPLPAPSRVVPARLNSTISGPRTPVFVGTGTPAGAGVSVTTTVLVYPTPATNVTKLTPSNPKIPAVPVGTGAAAGTSTNHTVVTIPVYAIPKEDETKPAASSPRVPVVLPSASAAVLSDAAAAAAPIGGAAAPDGLAPAAMLPNSTTLVGRRLRAVHRRSIHKREAADFLLTVYAAVAKEEAPKQAPAMGNKESHASPPVVPQGDLPSSSDVAAAADLTNSSDVAAAADLPDSSDVAAAAAAAGATPPPTPAGSRITTTTVVTTVSYETVYPSDPARIVTAVFVTTIVKAHCGCTETPKPVMTVSMSTKVVTCSACGHNGESTVTITVPCSASVEATPTPASIAPPPPPHAAGGSPPAVTRHPAPAAPGKYEQPKPTNKMTPASNGNTAPPPQAAGEESLTVNQQPGGKYEQPTAPKGKSMPVPNAPSGNTPPPPPQAAGDEPQPANQQPGGKYEQPKPSSEEVIAASSGEAPCPPEADGGESPAVNHEPVPVAPVKPGSNAPPPPPAKGIPSAIVPPAPSGSGTRYGQPARPPPTVAGASGFKVTSVLFTTVLAMVLLLL